MRAYNYLVYGLYNPIPVYTAPLLRTRYRKAGVFLYPTNYAPTKIEAMEIIQKATNK